MLENNYPYKQCIIFATNSKPHIVATLRDPKSNCVIKWALTIPNLSRWMNFVAKFAYRYPFHTFYMLVKKFIDSLY